jgi:DNA-binding NarL/FixJ family response regulator
MQRVRIFIAEPNPRVRSALLEVLEAELEGVVVVETMGEGARGIDNVSDDTFHVLIVNGHELGFEVMYAAQRVWPTIKVVALTTMPALMHRQAFESAGAAIFDKADNDLIPKLRAVVESARPVARA